MNASYRWLEDIVPTGLSASDLRDIITMRCAPVDEIRSARPDLHAVVVGLVAEAARHPNSDHLWVTRVDAGTGELLDVVCGASNVLAGKRYPFAAAGTVLPGGLRLEKKKIRGAISNGMLCSARELRLGESHEGILELDTDAAPGTPLLAALPSLADSELVIDVAPVRPDLLSHVGLAREIAAARKLAWSLPAVTGADDTPVPGPLAAVRSGVAGSVKVELLDDAGCHRYMAVVIRGVTVGATPEWLVNRLQSVGVRSINNVVDVTNYLLHELGQPMHAFDIARLQGSSLLIRRARPAERMTTLDGVERELTAEMTVIADAERAQAVAGVMGGSESEVGEATTDVLLEVATFDAASVRRTRRALRLSTDASFRFERGTDIELPPMALERAVQMIIGVAGGRVDGRPVDVYPTPRPRRQLELRLDRVQRLLGESVSTVDAAVMLERIGFEVERRGPDRLMVSVPSWRVDVSQEVDLIEEVARLRGYESFSDELRSFRPGAVPDAALHLTARKVRDTLVGAGLFEARTMPFVRGGDEGHVRVMNPLAESEGFLRRRLLDTLARRAEHNLAHMHGDIRLFELGAVFAPGSPHLREEARVAALVMGRRHPPHWSQGEQQPPSFDVWDAKWLGELVASTAEPGLSVEMTPGSGDVLWDIAVSGRSRGTVERVPLDGPVWAAPAFGVEFTLEEQDASAVAPPGRSNYLSSPITAGSAKPHGSGSSATATYRSLPTTPATDFDVALLVPNDMPAARVEAVMRSTGGDLLESLVLFDEFRGEAVPSGYRSLAWRLTFRHATRTLQAKEIHGRRDKLLRTLEGELGVRPRTS
ncbi:MAG: phenylalanine--tRNA ligase subunit beta [Gemmatimonadaceae bacterium]